MKTPPTLFSLSLVILAGATIGVAWYMGAFSARTVPAGQEITAANDNDNVAIITSSTPNTPNSPLSVEVEEYATDLKVPWSMAWTSGSRLLVTERTGTIREIVDGNLNAEPVFSFEEVATVGEAGLMGLAIDPQYQSNKYIYAALAYRNGNAIAVKVERLRDEETGIVRDKTLIDSIPAGQYHAGTRLVFGPDDLLYITTGDGTQKAQSQEDTNLAGKVLRMTRDGNIPEGQQNYVLMKGIRNSQGLAFIDDKTILLTDHGPSVFDGPAGGDEINIATISDTLENNNFGWPLVSHAKTMESTITPQIVFTPAVAPGSALVYKGSNPALQDSAFVGLLKGEGILHIRLTTQDGKTTVASYSKLEGIDVGRIRDIVEGPDGSLYATTSNTDGRGRVRAGDDKVLRISFSN